MALELNNKITGRSVIPGLAELAVRLQPKSRVSDKERMFFTEQLALLLETGSNLHASLRALKIQMENPVMGQLIGALETDIAEGRSFSQALASHPKVFSKTYVNLIAASEGGGFMHQVLEQLLEMDEKRDRLRSSMTSALSYPAFLLVFALSVVIFVLVVVFPKFSEMFSLIEDQLPATTSFLMAASEVLRKQWPALLGLVMVLTFGARFGLQTPVGRQSMDRLKLGLPLVGDIFSKLYLVQFLRVMGLSLGNGVGMVDTLQACREVVQNNLFQRFIADIETRVQEGGGFSSGFNDSNFIPPVVAQMMATGEETGSLPRVMGRLADYYERELSRKLSTFTRLVEPVMLLVMGAVVGLLVSSLILPIFKLSRAVH